MLQHLQGKQRHLVTNERQLCVAKSSVGTPGKENRLYFNVYLKVK